jgi:beta-lactamase regulating signal transducer with metallopeptidase domain
MRRALVLAALLLALAAPAAFAQSSAFGPLPPATTPAPTVTPVKTSTDQASVSKPLLLGIAGAVALLFLAIGLYIARDARSKLTETDRHALERGSANVEQQRKEALLRKQKARARAKAQRQARKKQRR